MNSLVKKNCQLVLICLIGLFLTNCTKKNPNPENLDPIYKDLLGKKKEYEKLIVDEEKNLESLKKERALVPPRSVEKKVNSRSIKKSAAKLAEYKQLGKYYTIRAERRRVEGRRAYSIAFDKGEAWPDPKEYQHYKAHMRLKEAPLNWNYRVPKLHKNNPNFKDPANFDKGK